MSEAETQNNEVMLVLADIQTEDGITGMDRGENIIGQLSALPTQQKIWKKSNSNLCN